MMYVWRGVVCTERDDDVWCMCVKRCVVGGGKCA